ncbi:hypothetical protein [Myroides sp. DF42-4-2]|uniref:hypothetical protein n=1 Tax=unclassified Myroides TaxID=2642485 RepID=UPI0025780523|nr:hypothetical protein [Myroides sp. DF42-4-2]MDM1406800.1 hypothetical protein [Myroides sp. DF42-4-2]
MNWKTQLLRLEQSKDWKTAINLLEETIKQDSNSIEAYLSMNYLLMNLLVEEQYDSKEHDYYAELLKKYFIESYSKFFDEAEYLFYIGQIACMSEWYFDIDIEKAHSMMKKASELEPNNILYKWANYIDLDMCELSNKKIIILYSKNALSVPAVIMDLESKGALGKYLFGLLEYWAKQEIKN